MISAEDLKRIMTTMGTEQLTPQEVKRNKAFR